MSPTRRRCAEPVTCGGGGSELPSLSAGLAPVGLPQTGWAMTAELTTGSSRIRRLSQTETNQDQFRTGCSRARAFEHLKETDTELNRFGAPGHEPKRPTRAAYRTPRKESVRDQSCDHCWSAQSLASKKISSHVVVKNLKKRHE